MRKNSLFIKEYYNAKTSSHHDIDGRDALVPLAVWLNDILVFSLAGLIPFSVSLKNEKA